MRVGEFRQRVFGVADRDIIIGIGSHCECDEAEKCIVSSDFLRFSHHANANFKCIKLVAQFRIMSIRE